MAWCRFVKNITRLKPTENAQEGLELEEKRENYSISSSVIKTIGLCFNGGLFVAVGMAVQEIGAAAMVLSVILGGFIAFLNNLCVSELCITWRNVGSYYNIVYCSVGELCAFILAWLNTLKRVFMIAIICITAGEYIKNLVRPSLSKIWSPGTVSWTDVKLDTLVFAVVFLVILITVISTGLTQSNFYVNGVFWLSTVVFFFILTITLYNANGINWHLLHKFEPFDFASTIRGVAITTFFFSNLDTAVEETKLMPNSTTTMPVSLMIALLVVLVYYLCSTIFVSIVVPIDVMNKTATIPKIFALTTFENSRYILCSIGLLVFCLVAFEYFFRTQKTLDNLSEDGLIGYKSIASKNPRKLSPLTVLVICSTIFPILTWLPVENSIQGYCILALVQSIAVNSVAIIVHYKPVINEEIGFFPNWESTKSCMKRFLLCFGYITNDKVFQKCGLTKQGEPTMKSSQLVNWSIVTHVVSSIGLALLMFHGLPIIGRRPWMILAALVLLIGSIFLTICIIMIQPRFPPCFFHHGFTAVLIPLINITLFLILISSLHWKSFIAIGIWLFIGLIVYFLYGMSHSQHSYQSRIHHISAAEVLEYNHSPHINTNVEAIQPENQYLYSDDSDDSITHDFPQKY